MTRDEAVQRYDDECRQAHNVVRSLEWIAKHNYDVAIKQAHDGLVRDIKLARERLDNVIYWGKEE